MDFFSNLWNWATSSTVANVASALAKTALLGYASRLLNGNTNPAANQPAAAPDPGVRLQLNPSTDNQIPVLYGSAYFGGNITDAQLSSDYKKMTYCLTLAETTGELLSTGGQTSYVFNNVYLNNNRVVFKADGYTVDYTLDSAGNQDISARDLIKVYFYKGQTGIQPSGKSGTTPNPWTIMPGWTQADYPMTGLLYAIVEVTYNRDKNISGIPDCIFHITSSMSLPGDCLVDYMLNSRYGGNISVYDIDGSFIDLNTYANAGFAYTDAYSQSQSGAIKINGLVDTTQNILSNMEEMARAASSWISYNIHAGQWSITINKAGSAIANFTDSNIIGDISISGTSLIQLNNAADVKYQNTDILDKSDFVKISIPNGSLYQNEPRSTLELSLPFTNKQSVALKVGLQALKQARVDKIISFNADYSYINLRAGDLISVTNTLLGYSSKVFRIITATEVEADDGGLEVEFKCLEYDANVYTYSIQEYLIETDDGLLSIGSIGKPNVPTVTKTEEANIPKIKIDAVVPSGIVGVMEFWLTFDVGVNNDANRTYIQIGQYSNTNGSNLTENDTVSYTYSGLAQSNFFVKVRGANNLATGPYSDPTGLIAYVPIVVADTVSNNPVSLNGQLMTLGLLTLLNNLDGLYKGLFGDGTLLDKILGGIKEVTGIDLKTGGPGVPGANGADGKDAGIPSLEFDKTRQYPLDRSTLENPETPYPNIQQLGPNNPNTVRISGTVADNTDPNGDYYFSISTDTALSIGSGDIKLYKSDGSLVQTLLASNLIIDTTNKVVKIPFASRQNKTDYYILMDEGVIKGANGSLSRAINNPEDWNFHTDTPSPRPVLKPPPPTPVPKGCPPLRLLSVVVKKFEDVIAVDNQKADIETNIVVTWNQGIKLAQSGTIVINSAAGVHQTFDLSKTFTNNKISTELVVAQGNRLYVNPTIDLNRGVTYWMTITANGILNVCGTGGNAAITDTTTIRWVTENGPTSTNLVPASPTSSANQDGLAMKFDQPITRSTGTIDIKNSAGTVIKSVPGTDPAVTAN